MIGIEVAELATMVRVLLGAGLAFGLLPMLVLPRPPGARNLLDAYVTNLIRWVAIVIILAHVLALLGIYSRVSLLATIFALAWFARYRKEFGGFAGVLQRLYTPGDDMMAVPKPPKAAPADRRRVALFALPPVALLVASFALRVKDVFGSMNLSPPDAYIHMAWANGIQQGNMWSEGVYPQGVASILAVLQSFTPFTDMIDVARFTGPLIGTFLVFSIYYAVIRLTRNPGAALFAAGLVGLFVANDEWRHPWERHVGVLPQELGLALTFIALVFAVLAVTEKGGGRFLALGSSGGLTMSGNMLSLGVAAFTVAMIHPYPLVWFAALIGAGAVAATLVTRRLSFLIGSGISAAVGAVVGIAVVPLAEFFGVSAYLGYGAVQAVDDVTTDRRYTEAQVLEAYNDLTWLQHNWLSRLAMVFLLVAIVGAVVLIVRRHSRTVGAQLLGLTAASSLSVMLFDLTEMAFRFRFHHVVRLAYLIGPTLALVFGAGIGALTVLVVRKVTFARVASLMFVGLIALGGVATQFVAPTAAIEKGYAREAIEWDEMTRQTLALKSDMDRSTYTVVGVTTQRQVLAGHGWFIEQWVFARDVAELPDDDLLPVPTADTYVFVELDPFPVLPVEGLGPNEEYYFDADKRGRIQAVIYGWAERRRAVNSDTTIFYDGEHVRVYRISRNPAITVASDDLAFRDYTWRPGELFNEGPTSPRQIEAGVASGMSVDQQDEAGGP